MDLIERYLQAIGRALPGHQRDDILSELRSSLYDELESEPESGSGEEKAVAMIKRVGPPRKVAASYYPEGQYLVGPTLYPYFKLVIGIVFTAVIGAQLLAVLLSLVVAGDASALMDGFWGILESLPVALGSVVAIFWVLQRQDVQIDSEREFDPRALPPIKSETDLVSRGERVFDILFSVVVLVILAHFVQEGGFAWVDGTGFFENPVIARYFPWIVLSMLAGIVLDIVLLWRGYWQVSTRIADVLSNLFVLVVLYLLIQGHNAWLAEADMPGLFDGLNEVPVLLATDPQLAGMIIFRHGLAVTAFIVGIETLVSLYRLLPTNVRQRFVSPNELIASNQ